MPTTTNKIAPRKDVDKISISIPYNNKKDRGLDWVESSWTRWIYVVFWTWVNPILNIGYQRQLTDDDLFNLSTKDDCNHLLTKLEKVWQIYETKYEYINIWKIIFHTFWKEALLSGLILLPYTAVKIAQPLLLKQIVLHINNSDSPSYIGYLYAIGLGLATFIQAILHQQMFFRATRVGVHARIGLSSLIYKKLLSSPTKAIMDTTTGHIINLISNDASKFEEFGATMHELWSPPLEALIIFGLVWNEIGLPTLFSYGVLFILIPLQFFFSRRLGIYRKNIIQWTDKRVKVINEILVGCQIVKMYRWEEALENVVCNTRKNEFQSIRQASRIRSINTGVFHSSLSLISLTTFVGSWLMGKTLLPANIFTVLSFLSMARFVLTGSFPRAIGTFSETKIAAKRINHFMNLFKQTRTKTLHDCSHRDESGCIIMDQASFTWGSTQSTELLNINLNISRGSLVGIIGTIGSGKSSLLSAILDEMSLVHGTSKVYGKIAYVSQSPWIYAGTIRENILFCKTFDKDKYERILHSCQLMADLQTFPAGDLTVIGEKGINLSGGQKARVSLARALYTDADIYLFDDPLAAVDPSVAKEIFKHCFSNQGLLNTKTRLLVTHQIQFLSEFDHCILLNYGQIEKQGLFTDLLTVEKIKETYENQHYYTNETKDKQYEYDPINLLQTKDKTSIVTEETSFTGNVSIKVWFKLFTSKFGWIGLLLLIFLMLLGEAFSNANFKWLSLWASKSGEEQRENLNVYIYLGLVLGTFIFAFIRADYFLYLILCGASTLHNNMFKGVLYSSLRFYESNPVGRILNRFSKDQQILDELLPETFSATVHIFILVLGNIVIIGITNPWILFIFIPIVPTFVWLRRYYLRTSRDLKRLESITRSPIYTLFSSSLNGLMTIRAFNMEKDFMNLFIEKMNRNSRVFFVSAGIVRWFGLRLDLMTCCLTFLTALLSVTLRNSLDPSSVALSLSYCISLTALFQWGVRQSAETENFMTSAERIDEYAHIPAEVDFYHGEIKPPMNWPIEGKIQFENYKLKYRQELEPVLKGINLEILPRNKIGIIGRTGAGKSSIFQALFRLIDKSSIDGRILIDGIDIHSISLNDLRSILNIIPQSPVLFSNTLRYNLDPFKHYTDEQLWNALEAVQLKTKIENLNDKLNIQIAEYGSNFSVGECQLICVARAILKQSKILLIDEATAHVDTHTDQLIQQILREKFRNQTIITIAHRLNTIMDSDRIVVMNDGIIAQCGTPNQILDQRNDLLTDINNDDNNQFIPL